MRKTHLLLGSVSAVAMVAAATGAQAQDVAPGGHTISIEGGGLFAKSAGADKIGLIESELPPDVFDTDTNDNLGYRAAISLGTKIDNFWDVRASAAVNHQLDATSTLTPDVVGPPPTQFTTAFDYETLDLEAGYTPELDGNLNVRLFGGVRGMHYSDRQSTDKLGEDGEISIDYKDEFLGVGPRIGVEGSARLGDSMFGISGSLSAAAIYGVSKETYDVEVMGDVPPPPPDVFPDTDTNKWVYNLEASLGLDAYLSDDATLTVGYRASTVGPVSENFFLIPGIEPETSRFSHGPTLKLTIQAD